MSALLAAWAVCRDRLLDASIVVSLIAIGMSLYSAGLNRGLALSSEWERRYNAEQERRELSDGRADRLLVELNQCRTCLSDDPKGCR